MTFRSLVIGAQFTITGSITPYVKCSSSSAMRLGDWLAGAHVRRIARRVRFASIQLITAA